MTDPTGTWVARLDDWRNYLKQRFVCIGNNSTPKLHALEYEMSYEERR